MKKIIKNPLVILAVAVVLLVGSSVGAARAAVIYQTNEDLVSFSTAEISCQLLENGTTVSQTDSDGTTTSSLSCYVPKTDESGEALPFHIGEKYDEQISVLNNSSSDYKYSEYVRVIVTKSWFNGDEKDTTLNPEYIKLELEDGWYQDTTASTNEQEIYYLPVALGYDEEAVLSSSIMVDNAILNDITVSSTSSDGKTTYTNTYDYNGMKFSLEVEVDAVQTHHAEDAIQGAWGVNVEISDDGTITSINGNPVDVNNYKKVSQ